MQEILITIFLNNEKNSKKYSTINEKHKIRGIINDTNARCYGL